MKDTCDGRRMTDHVWTIKELLIFGRRFDDETYTTSAQSSLFLTSSVSRKKDLIHPWRFASYPQETNAHLVPAQFLTQPILRHRIQYSIYPNDLTSCYSKHSIIFREPLLCQIGFRYCHLTRWMGLVKGPDRDITRLDSICE